MHTNRGGLRESISVLATKVFVPTGRCVRYVGTLILDCGRLERRQIEEKVPLYLEVSLDGKMDAVCVAAWEVGSLTHLL